jgi:undecaprenyl-diphosphatase
MIPFLNTNGVFILVVFVVLYEIFVARKRELAAHVILSFVTVTIFSLIIKELFLVPRPYLSKGLEAGAGLAYYSSLPSIHAAVAFCLATTVTMHQKSLGVFLFTVAAIVSIGRVLALVHYPMDIVLGMLIGVLTGLIFNQIHINIRKK